MHSWASHDRLMHDPTALQEVQKDLSHLSQGQTSMLGSSPSSNAWHRLQVILCAGLALVSRILHISCHTVWRIRGGLPAGEAAAVRRTTTLTRRVLEDSRRKLVAAQH